MKRTYKTALLILGLLAIFYLTAPDYLTRALQRLGPRIDDYTIFDNRIITAGNPAEWALDKDYNRFSIPEDLRTRIEDLDPVAFLVIQDNKIKFEEYWEGYSEHSLSNSFSAAKSVVALLVGIALEEGKIQNLDQKVGDFIPSYKTGTRKVLTLKHLLTMSSGLNWEEQYTTPFSMTAKAYYGNNITPLVTDLKVVEDPGKFFQYLSGNTQLLAMVVASATGQNISDYASQKVWSKIGATHDALWSLDREGGMEKAYCCFNSNARDFARFGQLILNDGQWGGQQIVSGEYVREATTPNRQLIDPKTGQPVDFYGYQWWIVQYKGYDIPYMRGILGQYIFTIREKNAVVVRLGHKRSADYTGRHPEDVSLYLETAFQILD